MIPSFLDLDFIIRQIELKGFDLFTNGEFNPNFVGIRTATKQVDVFDDWQLSFWREKGSWNTLVSQITTDPGLYYLGPERMGNAKGTFQLKGDHQHKGLWQKGYHKGRYPALVQKGIAVGYRDHNQNMKLDPDMAREMLGYGINNHYGKSEGKTNRVGPYSSGCQVHERADNQRMMMRLVDIALKYWPNSFSYTLLEEEKFL